MTELALQVETSGRRLDRYIVEFCPTMSRAAVQRLIKEGHVQVNGVAQKASYAPVPGDVIRLRMADLQTPPPAPEAFPLAILYEDEHLLVLDKPAGLVVHPGAGHPSGTLVNAVLAHRPDIVQADLDPQRPGIVHRLDRDTTGVLVVAVTRSAQEALQAAFRARAVDKTYLALLHGHLGPPDGAIEAPIARDPHNRTRMWIAADGGRYARTVYHVRTYLPGSTLVEAHPLTGRTHQLRVHFASIGYPVVGDPVYGRRRSPLKATRQMLHAWRLTFAHPVTGAGLTFTAEIPTDMRTLLGKLEARQPLEVL